MKKGKYNVLLMRDDSKVVTFRLSSLWIKIALGFAFFLLLIALIGGWAGTRYYKKHKKAALANTELKRTLAETTQRLESLENIQKIIESSDPEDALAVLSSVSANESRIAMHPSVNLKDVFESVNLGMVDITNVKAKFVDEGMQVKFEVNNVQPQRMLSGKANLTVISIAGTVHQVPVKNEEMSFQIENFKPITVTFPLPNSLTRGEVFGLRMTINDKQGKNIFSETYPLSDILS